MEQLVNIKNLYCPTCGKNLQTGKSYDGIMKEFIDSIYGFAFRAPDLSRALNVPMKTVKSWISGTGKEEFKGKKLSTYQYCGYSGRGTSSPILIPVGAAFDFFKGTSYEREFRMKVLLILKGAYSL